MAHKGRWAKICKRQKNQECFNCDRRLSIQETKEGIVVSCDIGHGPRELKFPRTVTKTPYCGMWKNVT